MHTASTNGNGKSRLNGLIHHIGAPIAPNHERADSIDNGTDRETPETVIPLMAWRERLTLLAGREKLGGKTTYAATAAAKLTSGGTHLGHQLATGTVLWVLGEGHWDDTKRPMKHAGADLSRVYVQRDLGTDRLAQLAANISDTKADVVIIDTLASFTDDRITNAAGADHWISIMNTLTRLAQHNKCAIVTIAHSRKDAEEVRDSTAITAGADMILRITDHRQPNARRIHARGRWPIEDHTIELHGAEYTLRTEKLEHRPSSSPSSHERKVREYLAANPHASKYATRKAVGGKSSSTDAIYEQVRTQVRTQNA